jgi:hypothetical protein
MRVATCTPVEFDADEHFFGRDSGLLARGFGMTGHESMVVMPGTCRSGKRPTEPLYSRIA